MTLYTHLPLEDVMAEKNDTEVKYKDTPSGMVMLQKNEEGAWIVQRLVSPDPNDYLNDAYQPGSRWKTEE
ncbi:YlzJ-like family protein [Salicibibacter kimchii]|uniref:Uncharacterized protein n=1 Tax=Salicibibacter kimchii TaxID=2099786 RepID=A0A345BVU9_9BACI|nr:YlzJ-like family protein [Salicibibacter kimchii]AXF55080.1 hypothetical protein DT065_02980 [Salicibibacter kimchii]